MKFGVIVSPGSNCDLDAYYTIKDLLGQPVEYIWHQQKSFSGFDCLILPGGFTYGDYLRPGAIASFSPVMEAVITFSRKGGLVLGICNGFQVLTEAGLLPGALYRNSQLRFNCRQTFLRVENNSLPFTRNYRPDQVIQIPVAHGDGNYYCDPGTLTLLEKEKRIVFRYVDAGGRATAEANPNGSLHNAAGVCNKEGNVLGMMPHPERASEDLLGSSHGKILFDSIMDYWRVKG